ncbi:hypothetical protein D3C75_1074190 [compost metagenome]
MLVGVSVAVQVMPPSWLLRLVSTPLAALMSAKVKPLTASLNVMVTRLDSPARNALSATTMVAVGTMVSTA